MDCDEALVRLKAGNERFVRGGSIHPHESEQWRRQLAAHQYPTAAILGCSDSLAPPEIIFDQGLGDLFVIRVAGNVISADTLGSIQYAAVYLKTKLFVVLGHEGCGAVRAALEERVGKLTQPGQIESLMRLILPGIESVDAKADPQTQLSAAVEANVRWAVTQITQMPLARKAVFARQVNIVGAIYESRSGQVDFLE